MRFWAMGRPIFPSPMTPTVVIVRLLPAGPRPSPDPVGGRAEKEPHGESALHDAPPEDLEGAYPLDDEWVLGRERGGLLLRGRPEHREARARRDARPRGQRAGGDDVPGGLQPEHPFQVSVEGGLDVRRRDPFAGAPPDDPELRAEHRRAFDRHRAPPHDLGKTVCSFSWRRQDFGQDVYAVWERVGYTERMARPAARVPGIERLELPEVRQAIPRLHAYPRECILDGRLPPGTKLSQVALAEQLGVSRTPLREVLRMLQEEGYVEFEPNPRIGDFPGWFGAHHAYHRVLTAGAGEPFLRQLQSLEDRSVRYIRIYQQSEPAGWQTAGDVEHAAILDALAAGDDHAALSGLAHHLARTALRVLSDCAPGYTPRAVPHAVALAEGADPAALRAASAG